MTASHRLLVHGFSFGGEKLREFGINQSANIQKVLNHHKLVFLFTVILFSEDGP